MTKIVLLVVMLTHFLVWSCYAQRSDAADFVAKFEGFSADTYVCPSGIKTIGYGCTNPDHVRKGHVSEGEARKCLRIRLKAHRINLEKKGFELTDNQWVAVLSLVDNIGYYKFIRSNTAKAILNGDEESIRKEWSEWRMGGGKVLPGLVRRRAEELKMFFEN